MVPIDCTSAGVINFSRSMKWPLHNVNRPDDRSDKSGPMLFPGYGPRILSVSALSLSPVAVPLASGRGQEAATSLSGPSFVPDGGSSTLAGWHSLGPAAWRADQGEIVGKGTGGSGWLVLITRFSTPASTRPFSALVLAIPAFYCGCSKRRRACTCGIGAAFNSQSFRRGIRCARRGPRRRWEDGYYYFHQKWNSYLLGKAGRLKAPAKLTKS
jgi:hypothetical protein